MKYKKALRIFAYCFFGLGLLQALARIFFDVSGNAFSTGTGLWVMLGFVCIIVDGALNEILEEIAEIKPRFESE